MRICLIFPKSTFLEDPMVFPPLGLWWLWSVLEQDGHEVSFIDMSENNLQPQDVPHGFDAYLVSGTSPQGREIRKLGLEFQRRRRALRRNATLPDQHERKLQQEECRRHNYRGEAHSRLHSVASPILRHWESLDPIQDS